MKKIRIEHTGDSSDRPVIFEIFDSPLVYVSEWLTEQELEDIYMQAKEARLHNETK